MTPLHSSLAIDARALRKRYGDVVALDDFSLQVPRGAFYAFLGPNGAGKSTTVSLVTGISTPDAGTLHVLGLDALAQPNAVKARLGVVPEELALFDRLTGRQHLTFCGRMFGLTGAEAARRADELLELTELSAKATALVGEYSKGMRRRLGIASALIHAPELLLLDEPFEGIDVLAARVIRGLLLELSRRGVTLVLTTHVLEIADRLATHAGFIRAGRMLDQGELGALLARHRARNLEEVFEALLGAPAAPRASLSFYPDAR